ncbi:MAG: glycosyltransferase family 2 protein [Actinomycetota bacterium]
MSVTVVTVAYRTGAALTRCLDSLAGEADEILVVDNGRGGAEIDEARQREGVRVLAPEVNLGFGGANNLAATEAAGDVLAFLNPDTVVAPGAVAQLARTLEDPQIGIAMARLRLLDEPEKLNSSGVQVHVTGIGWAGGFGEPASPVDGLQDVPAPSGTAMAIRSDTFRELGGFAEELFMYLEDLELGWRARLAGYRVVLDPAADVFHEYEYERNPRKSYFLERNRLVFVLSSYSLRQLLLMSPLLLATELGMVAIAAREHWLRDKVGGWGWLARNTRLVARRRRTTQQLRRVRDRDLAAYMTPTFSPGMVAAPALLRAANPVVRGYWKLVTKLL